MKNIRSLYFWRDCKSVRVSVAWSFFIGRNVPKTVREWRLINLRYSGYTIPHKASEYLICEMPLIGYPVWGYKWSHGPFIVGTGWDWWRCNPNKFHFTDSDFRVISLFVREIIFNLSFYLFTYLLIKYTIILLFSYKEKIR